VKRYLTIIIHIAAWSCLFLLPFVFAPRREPNFQYSDAYIFMLVSMNAFLLAFFYSNSQIFIPKLLARRKWLWYTLIIICCFIIFLLIPKLFEEAIREDLPEKVRQKLARRRKSGMRNPFNGASAVFFLVFTISTCMKVIQQWLGAEKKKQEVENDKVVTELSFLKSQINPHFLFNTLNNIYSLAIVKSDATAGAVLKLSSIMRYVLNETKNEQVPLDDEIKFINDYIELQKVRLTDKVSINFSIEGNTSDKLIAPLILIPFVENAFKYGISTKENSSIDISLNASETAINFKVTNKVVAAQTDKFENTGIGLKNTQRRLELLYPSKHELIMNQENNTFLVTLTLHK
jgi:two-component system LytT family sensor kinase